MSSNKFTFREFLSERTNKLKGAFSRLFSGWKNGNAEEAFAKQQKLPTPSPNASAFCNSTNGVLEADKTGKVFQKQPWQIHNNKDIQMELIKNGRPEIGHSLEQLNAGNTSSVLPGVLGGLSGTPRSGTSSGIKADLGPIQQKIKPYPLPTMKEVFKETPKFQETLITGKASGTSAYPMTVPG